MNNKKIFEHKGMTLVEIMVAVGLMGFLALFTHRMISRPSKEATKLQQRLESKKEIAFAFKDIADKINRSTIMKLGVFTCTQSGANFILKTDFTGEYTNEILLQNSGTDSLSFMYYESSDIGAFPDKDDPAVLKVMDITKFRPDDVLLITLLDRSYYGGFFRVDDVDESKSEITLSEIIGNLPSPCSYVAESRKTMSDLYSLMTTGTSLNFTSVRIYNVEFVKYSVFHPTEKKLGIQRYTWPSEREMTALDNIKSFTFNEHWDPDSATLSTSNQGSEGGRLNVALDLRAYEKKQGRDVEKKYEALAQYTLEKSNRKNFAAVTIPRVNVPIPPSGQITIKKDYAIGRVCPSGNLSGCDYDQALVPFYEIRLHLESTEPSTSDTITLEAGSSSTCWAIPRGAKYVDKILVLDNRFQSAGGRIDLYPINSSTYDFGGNTRYVFSYGAMCTFTLAQEEREESIKARIRYYDSGTNSDRTYYIYSGRNILVMGTNPSNAYQFINGRAPSCTRNFPYTITLGQLQPRAINPILYLNNTSCVWRDPNPPNTLTEGDCQKPDPDDPNTQLAFVDIRPSNVQIALPTTTPATQYRDAGNNDFSLRITCN